MTFDEWWNNKSGWGGQLLSEGQLAKRAWEYALSEERHSMTNIAYHMIEAYKYTRSQGQAIEQVKDKFPKADLNMLWIMWLTIDAYLETEK